VQKDNPLHRASTHEPDPTLSIPTNIKIAGPGITMRHFNAEDEKVHKAWLRPTAFAHGGLVLLAVATVTTLAVTHAPTASSYLVAATGLGAP
jgi:hypothetical protein